MNLLDIPAGMHLEFIPPVVGVQTMNLHPGDILTPEEIKALLHRLNGSDPGAAWAEFIDDHSPLILKVVYQFEYEQDRNEECFLYVCEKLCDDGFRRLLQFNTRGKASFRTWLGSVVFNLCVDWHRHEFGRATLLPAISALPEFDQSVYRICYQQGMNRQSSLHCLQEDFPDLNAKQLSDSIARIHRVLTPRQRWKLAAMKVRRQRGQGVQPDPNDLPDTANNPETQACDDEAIRLLRAALEQLPRDQRLAVDLRYIQGMTLRQVAELLGLGDPYRARRLIQAALDQLAKEIPGIANKDFI